MTKVRFAPVCLSGCLLAFPALAGTPATTAAPSPAPVAADKPAPAAIIKIGDRYCPAVPESTVPNKTQKILTLMSATCVMEASGLITHDEAQGVYDQALGAIQMDLSQIQTDDTEPALASK